MTSWCCFDAGMPGRIRTCDLRSRSYVAVHESSAFWQVFMYDAQNMAVCKTALSRCGAIVHSCFLCHRENSSQLVVWTDQRLWSSIQQRYLVDKLFHVLHVGIRGVFGIDFRWVQNDDLHSICPQSLQRPRQTASLIWSFAEIGNASLLIKYFCTNIYFSVTLPCPLYIIASNRPRQTHRVCTRTKSTQNFYSWEYSSQAHTP